jgi:hypothetical protein
MGTDAPESMGFRVNFGNNVYITLQPTQKRKPNVYLMHSQREELWNRNCRICSGEIITGALRTNLAFNGCLIAQKRANRQNRTKLRGNEKLHYLSLSLV